MVLPAYYEPRRENAANVDPESPGYEAALGELEGRTNIPTQRSSTF